MAHFARVENGIVREVIVVSNDAIDSSDEEASGRAVLAESGIAGEFWQCSYSGSFRGCYPAAGYLWDGENFIDPKVTPEPEPLTPAV